MELADDFDTFGPLFAGEVLHVEDLLDFDLDDIDEAEQEVSSTSSSTSCYPSLPPGVSSMAKESVSGVILTTSSPLSQHTEAVAGHHQHFEPEELDWLQDSYAMYNKAFGPVGRMCYGELQKGNKKSSKENTGSQGACVPLFTHVVKAARTTRARSGGRAWYLQMQAWKKREPAKRRRWTVEDADGSDGSCLDVDDHGRHKKKGKKATGKMVDHDDPEEDVPRKCSHCQVQKTPQWRAGPLGPKTLCNACGVRFKSGRLLPEYRPAASPTFRPDLYSNAHKKVLEMRRLKPIEQGEGPCMRSRDAAAMGLPPVTQGDAVHSNGMGGQI